MECLELFMLILRSFKLYSSSIKEDLLLFCYILIILDAYVRHILLVVNAKTSARVYLLTVKFPAKNQAFFDYIINLTILIKCTIFLLIYLEINNHHYLTINQVQNNFIELTISTSVFSNKNG